MSNNKGITMISLVITIIVLLIVTSITIYNGVGQLGIKRVNNLYADIDSISTKVDDYYLKNESLPIYENNKYVDSKEELEALFRRNGATENITNVNDGEDYYVLKLSKLDNLTLNYGEDYIDWEDTSTADDIQNLYIINSVTHQIYFPHGIRSGDDYYFARVLDENEISPIELEEIEANWTMNITNISENNIDENNSSIVADVSLSGLNTNYDLNSLEYAWSETDIESQLENTDFTRFNVNIIDEDNLTATLSSKALSNTAEYYYLWVKVVDINGKTRYQYAINSASPLTGNLPSNYQSVEYLESTGTQYIDLNQIDISLNDIVRSDIIFQYTGTLTNNFWVAGDGRMRGSIQFEFGKYSGWYNISKGDYESLEGNGNNAKIKAHIIHQYTENTSILWRCFGRNPTMNNNITPCKIWKNTLTINDKLVFNLIPCYRKSDNVNGLYDLVEGHFYTNQGTGDDFIIPDNNIEGD